MAKKKPTKTPEHLAGDWERQKAQTTVYNAPKPKPKPKPPAKPKPANASWESEKAQTQVKNPVGYKPKGPGTGSTNAAERAFNIPSAPPGAGNYDPYNGWDAQSLIDETLGESGWYGDGGSSSSGGSRGRRGGGGGGRGGSAGPDPAALGELAGADAQTAALNAYLAQLQGTQGLREKPFADALANLATMYEAGKGTIGQAQTDVQARLGANKSSVEQALANYVAQSGQMNQQASGSGRAELERLMTDLRAQGMDTGQLQGQANLQDSALQQAFLRDQQRNAALGQANTDAFASRDSTAGLVNASALGGLEANRLNIGGQISQAQAQAMLQFQQEIAQAQLQVAQQKAQADALRAALGLAPEAAPVAATPAQSASPQPAPQAQAQRRLLVGDVTRNPGAMGAIHHPAPRPPSPLPPGAVDPGTGAPPIYQPPGGGLTFAPRPPGGLPPGAIDPGDGTPPIYNPTSNSPAPPSGPYRPPIHRGVDPALVEQYIQQMSAKPPARGSRYVNGKRPMYLGPGLPRGR